MTDIDHLLSRIGQLPIDPRVAGIDEAIFAGLAEARRPVVPRAAFGAIAGFALLAGMLAASVPHAPIPQAGLYPLGVPVALAPSTLLGGDR